ncbi:protein virilizer [Planococcus citri]|uniref:protein virilizer n=1 Tax=Planococcus citri TaxID=170843 RepID=UPI0031F9E251
MAEYPELLFFDTFSHGSTQELNLDLVQFTNPVYVTEIRIIPLGARVQADFPGGVRLGATNPSEFSIEFFVNDLSTPGATFQNIGILEYNQNGPIHHVCENKQIPTDGLILRGWYTTVTLAVYGFITKTRPTQLNLVSQNTPTPPAVETPTPRVISEHKTAEWVQQHAQVYHKETAPEYDVKDVPFVEENSTPWPPEKNEEKEVRWEKQEIKEEPKEERKPPVIKPKESPEPVKPAKRRSSADESTDRSSEHHEHKKHDDKKVKPKRARRSRSPSKSKSKSKSDSKKRRHDESEPEPVVTPEKRDKTPDPVSPKPVQKETPSASVTFSTPSLAPEDVELISEEEISEAENSPPPASPANASMTVMDKVSNVPASENLTPSAQEDSLDMDQFEPILSGSSDIESEEEIDLQDVEFDPNDLVDEPSKIFDPFIHEVQPLLSMKSPCITDYEWGLLQRKIFDHSTTPPNGAQIEKFKTLLSNIQLKIDDDIPDEWVTLVETLTPLIKTSLISIDDRTSTLSALTSLVNIGLDFDKAYNQSKPVFKVRHLKAGIKLAETLCRCGETIAVELIKATNLHHKLLDLYEKEYVALSVKLAILKALDISLNYGTSVEQFLATSNDTVCYAENGYQRLVKVFRNTRLARVRYSLINIFRKLHLYEVLENVYAITAVDSDSKPNRPGAEDVENLSMFLEETLRYLREAPMLICQPVRLLPVCSRFEFPINTAEASAAVYSYLQYFHFIELIATAIAVPEFIAHPGVVSCILEILAELLDTEEGMLYLASQSVAANRILKMLTSTADDQYAISPQLGLHMAHTLHVLNLADGFQYKWRVEQTTDIDNSQLLETLSSLYHLTSTILGKHAVTHVLSRGDLIKPFLKALQYSRSSGRERRKSPGKAYIQDLMWMVVRSSDNVTFLERHRSDLIEVGSWQSDSNNSSWLNPIRNESCFSYNDITDLCDYLKKHTEKAILYPGELITAVRLLRHLAVPCPKYVDEEECTELKYKFVLIQLFSQEGLTYLTSVLHKICNHYERPHLHACTLAGKEGSAMISLVLPAVQLIRALVEYVVRCRDVDFKDLTAVPALLKTYCLMFYITQTSLIHSEVGETMKEIVETLLSYTQTVAIEPLNDSRSLNKSVWTLMMSEVLKYATSLPETFLPCLSLISELLPLPFPIQTKTPLTESEILLATNSRKLWSAHLLPLNGQLQEFLVTLCYSSSQPLLQVLKRVCVQLSDLGPPSALAVSRSVLTSLWNEISGGEKLSSRAVRLLNVLACLLNHSALKMSVIQITTAPGKGDEMFAEFWTTILTYLATNCTDNVYHVQGQEYILSMIQALCDIEISLYPPPSQTVSVETYLSNSLPSKNLFRMLCEALVKHVENQSNAFSSIAAALRTCITLTEYDYGMYRLKVCLSEYPNTLYNVVQKLAQEWNKENADCLSCLSALLDLLKECASRDIPVQEGAGVNLRTLSISCQELAKLLKWSHQNGVEREASEEKHVLEQLDSLLLESSTPDTVEDLFQSMRANVTTLIGTLNDAQNTDGSENAAIELILDLPEPLLTQFQSRPVFVLGDVDDERLSVAYWLSVAPLDDIDQDTEQVVCNLEEVVSTFIPNFNLETELEKLGHREAAHHDLAKKDSAEASEELENKPIPTVLAIKPAKPRTFMRPIIGPHRNDAFRSRIPNSSRAPSLHVDDFIALEKHNQQAASTGYNRITGKHQISDITGNVRNRTLHSFLQDRNNAAAAVHFHSSFRPARGVLNSWHPLLSTKPSGRTVVKNQPSVIRHPTGAPLMIRGADLMRFSMALRWPPPVRPGPPQLRHHPPPHASILRHLRPPPPSFPPI